MYLLNSLFQRGFFIGGIQLKFSSISDDFFHLFNYDKELLFNKNGRRPYLIIIKLKYKNKKHDFAIPLRSNIANYIPKEQYFSLPPRAKTKNNKIHGLHYIKMFPIKKEFLQKFHIDKDNYYKIIINLITRNKKQIVSKAQDYLTEYELGNKNKYSPDIDKMLSIINSQSLQEVATTKDSNSSKK